MDPQEENLWNIAKEVQQSYCELLPGWTIYEEEDYKYLKQNIGFAIYGLMLSNWEKDKEKIKEKFENDITKVVTFDSKEEKVVNAIFKQIFEHGKGYSGKDSMNICCDIIYNVFILKNEKKELDKDKLLENLNTTPIFRIKTNTNNELIVRYIDTNARMYKSWTDYKTCNTLPKCTMFLPLYGYYQANPNFPMTTEHFMVYLEIVDSPSCKKIKKVMNIIDNVFNVVGFASLGAVALTPIAPIAVTAGLVAGGVSGLWTFGRSTQKLVDRKDHKESIKPTSNEAVAAWLGIAAPAVGFAANAGTVAIAKAVESGKNISKVTKYAVNAAKIGNIGVNTVSVGQQAYQVFVAKGTNERVDITDITLLGINILFLSNAVINLKLAGSLIESTQGKILDDYKSSLRSKNSRKMFNRANRAAASNNANSVTEKAEIIRYINTKKDMLQLAGSKALSSIPGDFSKTNAVKLISNKFKVLDTLLLDPSIIGMGIMAIKKLAIDKKLFAPTTEHDDADEKVLGKLRSVLGGLLENISTIQSSAKQISSRITDFESILQQARFLNMKDAVHVIKILFQIAIKFTNSYQSKEMIFIDVARFFWKYAKVNLEEYCKNCNIFGSRQMTSLFVQIFMAILNNFEALFEEFCDTFENCGKSQCELKRRY